MRSFVGVGKMFSAHGEQAPAMQAGIMQFHYRVVARLEFRRLIDVAYRPRLSAVLGQELHRVAAISDYKHAKAFSSRTELSNRRMSASAAIERHAARARKHATAPHAPLAKLTRKRIMFLLVRPISTR